MHIAILGCGNMGSAMAIGLRKKYGNSWDISVYDPRKESVDSLNSLLKYPVEYSRPTEWFIGTAPDIVVIAVKPQIIPTVLSALTKTNDATLWVSIAAGVREETLKELLPKGSKVSRVMPNTPALIGEALSAFSLSQECGDKEREKVTNLLGAIGEVVEVQESAMAAVTGLSGSGPAYVFTIIEALTEGAVAMGLSYDIAQKSAAQTVLGAAKMVLETGESPAVLRSKVMSPGGTTAAGIVALEEAGVRGALMGAVKAATQRAIELG